MTIGIRWDKRMRNFQACLCFIFYSVIGHAQSQACSVADFTCLSEIQQQECKVRENTVDSCMAWLNSIENLIKEHPNVAELQLMKGVTHYTLHDMFRISGNDLAQTHKKLAQSAYLEVYSNDQSNILAMRGLSTTSETPEEVQMWNQRILEVDPTDVLAAQRIAGVLIRSGDKTDYIDAANILRKSYDAMEPGSGRWALAERIMTMLELSENSSQIRAFEKQVMEDMAINQLSILSYEDVNNNPGQYVNLIRTYCYISTLNMFGVEHCLDGVVLAFQSTVPGNTVWGSENVDSYLYAANSLIVHMMSQSKDTSDLELKLKGWINSLIAHGTETGAMYQMLQFLYRDDPQLGLQAALKSVELEPENGNYQLMAGQWLVKIGQLEEGIKHFEKAKVYLPAVRHHSIDIQIQSAQD